MESNASGLASTENQTPRVGAKVVFLKSLTSSDNSPVGIVEGDRGILLTTNREGHWGVYVKGKRLFDVKDPSAFEIINEEKAPDVIITKKYRILDRALLMNSAQEIDRISGRDNDWTPDNVVDAIQELELIGEGSPVSNGYEVICSATVFSRDNALIDGN